MLTDTECRNERLISRWEHEDMLEVVQELLEGAPDAMELRRQTVEHAFGTLKGWMGSSHFLTKMLPLVATEMSLHVLVSNLKRVINFLGTETPMKAMLLLSVRAAENLAISESP